MLNETILSPRSGPLSQPIIHSETTTVASALTVMKPAISFRIVQFSICAGCEHFMLTRTTQRTYVGNTPLFSHPRERKQDLGQLLCIGVS